MSFPKVLLGKFLLAAAIFALATIHDDQRELSAAEAGQPYIDRMNILDRMIKDIIGEPRADNLTQCRLMAYGAKACGGPAAYLAFSTARTNEAQLTGLVDEYNQNARNYNQVSNRMSDCMFVMEPQIELISGICKLR
ncbi:MAG: hypothetical protein EXR70_11000 [Deltaproteobacteria bacterium]|nr:hypothetical protein [Deltaproteobacteria bacterium]